MSALNGSKIKRKHLLQTAAYWFDGAREHEKRGETAKALMSMEQAYNHLENALFEGVQCMRGTCPIGFLSGTDGERRQKFLDQFKHIV